MANNIDDDDYQESKMNLGIYKLDPAATIPEFQTEGAACFDIVATKREPKGNAMLYSTGLAFEIPDGYHVKIYSRSGHGFRDNIRLCNSTGIIDADYTGEVKVKLVHDGPPWAKPSWPWVGDRVAQGMLVRNVKTTIVEVFEQKQTDRGDGGFGSTGK